MALGQSPAAESPVAAAVTDLRTTAKWTIAAFAGVGVLLLGGTPVAAVSKINDMGDAAAVFAGLALGLLGVGWAVWQTSEAITPRITLLSQLDAPGAAALRAAIARDPAAFYGPFPPSPDQLRSARVLHQTAAANLAAAAAREDDERKRSILEQARADAQANAALAERVEGRLLELIHATQVHAAVRRARLHTAAAAITIAVGAVLVLTATSDNKPEKPPPGPAKTGTVTLPILPDGLKRSPPNSVKSFKAA
ncbi:hypothetical protein E1200_09195 [Actinomadura sp. GC306]|uniref:hypothetical protein n=1 Tax=Actinomadura sp. GC306 TaxID=2530367 RepID=UPI001044D1ED|nr:hypothetical protein [Actinomadura sp. GC306]TDC69188.1 hypothetical protein E1200_09195 [Actinomadura sp. GC306]